MKKLSLLASLLSVIFLSGCDSLFLSENHEEDFREVMSKGVSGDSISEICGSFNSDYRHGTNAAKFLDFTLDKVQKSKSAYYGVNMNIKTSEFKGNVDLYCSIVPLFSDTREKYNNISVSGEISIYQEVSEVNGEKYLGEWKFQNITMLVDEH